MAKNKNNCTSSLMFGVVGAALFKFICDYVSTYRDIASVTKEINQKVDEIRLTWSSEKFGQLILSKTKKDFLQEYDEWNNFKAFGVVLMASERLNSVGKVIPGWKIVCSGDTRQCSELTGASFGAIVLIHEATFDDGMMDEAIERNQSTTKEAIEVWDSAGVYRVILTHFSQRYPKIPVFDETHMHKTCVGFDMMSINIADLRVLPKVLPYLKLLFRNEMVVDESDEMLVDELQMS